MKELIKNILQKPAPEQPIQEKLRNLIDEALFKVKVDHYIKNILPQLEAETLSKAHTEADKETVRKAMSKLREILLTSNKKELISWMTSKSI